MKKYQHVLIEQKYKDVLKLAAQEQGMKDKVYVERLLLKDKNFIKFMEKCNVK